MKSKLPNQLKYEILSYKKKKEQSAGLYYKDFVCREMYSRLVDKKRPWLYLRATPTMKVPPATAISMGQNAK